MLHPPLEQNTIEVLPGIEILTSFNMNGVRVQDDESCLFQVSFHFVNKNRMWCIFHWGGLVAVSSIYLTTEVICVLVFY